MRIEIRGVVEQSLVVVAHHADLCVAADEVDAVFGIRSIAHDVPEADHRLDALRADVSEDRVSGLLVRMQVGYERDLHGRT